MYTNRANNIAMLMGMLPTTAAVIGGVAVGNRLLHSADLRALSTLRFAYIAYYSYAEWRILDNFAEGINTSSARVISAVQCKFFCIMCTFATICVYVCMESKQIPLVISMCPISVLVGWMLRRNCAMV